MRIGIDIRVLQEGSGGVYVYAHQLLQHLIPLAARHQLQLFANQYHARGDRAIQELARHKNVTLHQYRFPNRLLNASLRFLRWPQIDQLVSGCEVLFFPSMMYAAWSDDVRIVTTMHDLSFEYFPELFTRKQQIWHWLVNPRNLCERSKRVIAVSASTKRDVADRYQEVDARKISVVHSGVSDQFRPVVDRRELSRARKKYRLPDARFCIQVGTLEPRKNHLLTLEAFNRWHAEYSSEAKNVHLIFAGHCGWKWSALRRAISQSPFRDKVHVITDFSAVDLPSLYSLAIFSIYPSLYEGFGFPILESMSCGVPVITAANSSLGEVAGDAGLLINPYRIDDALAAIRRVAGDPDFAKILRARGLARSATFGWDKCAVETLRVLEQAARSS